MEVATDFMLILFVLALVLWLWALIDIARSRFKKPAYKILWILAILFFPILGSILYFMLKKEFILPKKRKSDPDFRKR